jgi:hypothetical protein
MESALGYIIFDWQAISKIAVEKTSYHILSPFCENGSLDWKMSNNCPFKGTVSRYFLPCFFHQTTSPTPVRLA